MKKSHTPIKTPKHLWGFLFIFPPDGGELKWEERKLQSIISTDFIDLIISDSWGSWMLFDVIWNKSTFLSLRILFFFFILLQTKITLNKKGSCVESVWALMSEAFIQIPRLLHIYLWYLTTSYSVFQNQFLHPLPWGIAIYLSISIMEKKKNPTLLLPSHFPLEAMPHINTHKHWFWRNNARKKYNFSTVNYRRAFAYDLSLLGIPARYFFECMSL